jgi:hypothetical protein
MFKFRFSYVKIQNLSCNPKERNQSSNDFRFLGPTSSILGHQTCKFELKLCGNPHELGEVATHSLKVERGVKVLVLKIENGRPGLKCFGHDMCLTLGNLGSNLVRLFFWA